MKKIKAVYKSKANRPKILICGETFINNKPRVANLPVKGINIIKKAAEQGWFEILDEYNKGEIKKTAIKKADISPAPVKMSAADEAEKERAKKAAMATEVPAEEPVAEPEEEIVPAAEETVMEEETKADVVLEDMKKDELIKLAEERGIEVTSSMKKDEIIAAITKG